jgi:hypothetical protein
MKLEEDPLYNTTADAAARIHARYTVLNHLVYSRLKEIVPYMSTPLVARDMLSIVRAHGREKLQYWGFS